MDVPETIPWNEIRQHLHALDRLCKQCGSDSARRRPKISFVSPCFNESENLEALCRRIVAACESERIADYEIVLVENGSHDDSEKIIRQLRAADPRIKMVQLSRNFGYQGAVTCGLAHSRGEWVAVLDADLQDPPELVPHMLEIAKEGYQVVYGVRAKRQEGPLKRLAYRLFYRLWRGTADIAIPLDAGDFCIMHRDVVDVINHMPERQRFIRGLRAWCGFRQTGFPYERAARAKGVSRFNLRAMFHLALDGILDFSAFPLRLSVWLGLMLILFALTISTIQAVLRLLEYAGFEDLTGALPPGLTHTHLLMIFLAGVNTFCLGVVAEYVGRMYNEVKQRPLYVVKQILS